MGEIDTEGRLGSFDDNIPKEIRGSIDYLRSDALIQGKKPCIHLKYAGKWFAYCTHGSPVIFESDENPNNMKSEIYKNHLDIGMLQTCILRKEECPNNKRLFDLI